MYEVGLMILDQRCCIFLVPGVESITNLERLDCLRCFWGFLLRRPMICRIQKSSLFPNPYERCQSILVEDNILPRESILLYIEDIGCCGVS